jgi:hypothetical protein
MTNNVTVANVRYATWVVFCVSLTAGAVGLCFNVWAALLPTAITFGWSQVCGF